MRNTDLSFGGVLQPLVDLLERKPRQGEKLIGQEVVINKKGVEVFIALDADNDIHLLITPSDKGKAHLSELDLKGLKMVDKEWSVSGHPVKNYLDVSCSTGTLPAFRRPFLRFSEDVLFEISQSEILPADAIYKTGIRWRKFWSPDTGNEITREWVHGLFGELLFLTDLIGRFGSKVIESWAGPLGKDHDFQKGTDLAAEIKTSVEVPFNINCNIHQLDSDLFKKLYIVCYRLTSSDSGTTLPQLVQQIEQLLKSDEVMLDKFFELLTTTGYSLQSEPDYDNFKMNYAQAAVFHVDNNFPKIVEKSFTESPDHRINGIRYTLQLTGLKELTVDKIENDLSLFSKSPVD